MGIRMALGAQPGQVMRLVLREMAALLMAGIACGAVAAGAGMRLVRSLLFQISAWDYTWALAAVAVLAAVALAAAYWPARRAGKVDLLETLRQE